jgi:hypothetical protein
MTDIRFKINYRAVYYYNGSVFKINPSFVFNMLKKSISVLFVGGRLGDASEELN